VDKDSKNNHARAQQRLSKKRQAKLLSSEEALELVDSQGRKLDGRALRAQKQLPSYQQESFQSRVQNHGF